MALLFSFDQGQDQKNKLGLVGRCEISSYHVSRLHTLVV